MKAQVQDPRQRGDAAGCYGYYPLHEPYDPRAHADAMKVRIVTHSLRDNYGIWVPERRMIILDRGCPAHLVDPVLAHECDHAAHSDPAGHHPRNEARANLHAAQRRINADEWDVLTKTYSDYDRICIESGITREQFHAYRLDQERKARERTRLELIGNVVYLNPKMGEGQWGRKFEIA